MSVDAIYTSHMLEHLDRAQARRFLAEVYRVLIPGGIVRVSVPDLGRLAERYRIAGDADAFVEGLLMFTTNPSTWRQRLRLALVGFRHHLWMYDASSLTKLLLACGFVEAASLPAGTTHIPSPGQLNLREREEESIYVEAARP
jgi:SAM-dependent methyltransferase